MNSLHGSTFWGGYVCKYTSVATPLILARQVTDTRLFSVC